MVNYSKGLEPNQKTISVWMIYEAEGCFMIMENFKEHFYLLIHEKLKWKEIQRWQEFVESKNVIVI